MKKKKECNDKAQRVVEKLIDPIEDEKLLLEMVNLSKDPAKHPVIYKLLIYSLQT